MKKLLVTLVLVISLAGSFVIAEGSESQHPDLGRAEERVRQANRLAEPGRL